MDVTIQSLADRKINSTINQLGAFTNEVSAQRGKKRRPEPAEGITETAADDLIAQAQVIIAMPSATPTPEWTLTSTLISTNTPLPTETSTPTEIPTLTPTFPPTGTMTEIPSPTLTLTPTFIPTITFTPTETFTPLPTAAEIPPAGPLTINYTYDALRRLKKADYSDGRYFSYDYDGNGNTLTASTESSTTSYTYDTANQLVTAQTDGVEWHYVYDANGSLVEVLPNGNQAGGAKRYTYNAAGYLVKVESHDGLGWSVQAEMNYNGLGTRMTSSALGVTTEYASDGQLPLAISSGNKTTTVLYGLGPIAEKMSEWNFVLTDGVGVPRQLTDMDGRTTLSVRYSPWGKPIETDGIGNFDASYIGTLTDFATNLIYIGNGQYYDPETGRFLIRNANPGSPNPYVPWNPFTTVIGPLGLVSANYTRKKIKQMKPWASAWVIGSLSLFLVACSALAVLGIVLGAFGIACGTGYTASPAPDTTGNGSGTAGPATQPATTPTSPGAPTETPSATPCPNGDCGGTAEPAPTSTPTPSPSGTEIEKTLQELVNYIFTTQIKQVNAQASRDRVKEYARWIMDKAANEGLDTNHLAYIYATTQVESQWYNFEEQYEGDPEEYFEIKYGYRTARGQELGNTDPGDGYRYMGRGFIHLTGRGNYARVSQNLGLGTLLVDYPAKAAYNESSDRTNSLDPQNYITRIAVSGMAGGWFAGPMLSNYDNADGSYRFYDARAIINWPGADGGNPRQQAGDLGIDFAEILSRHCPLGGVPAGMTCRTGP